MKESEKIMIQCDRGKTVNIHIEEILYYVFIIVLMGAKGIGLTDGQRLFTLCLLSAAVLWVLKICLTRHSVREWLLILALLLLGGIIYRRTGEKAAIAAAAVIVGMKNVPLERLMKVSLAVWGGTFLFSIIRALLGFYDGVVVVHEKLGLGPIIRYSLGYTHPNVLHVTYFILVMLIIYVCRPHGKKLYWSALLLFGGNLYVFLYSISYTGILIVTAYLLLVIYFDIRKKLMWPEKAAALLLFVFCVAFPIAGPFLLKGEAFHFFNRLLSTRFELVYNNFTQNKVTLLGTYIPPNPEVNLSLDSSFAYMLMYYGIIAFVLCVGLYFFSIYYCMSHSRLQETAILLGTAIAGITEQFLYNLSFKNLTFFIMGYVLYEGLLKSRKTLWICRERTLMPVKKNAVIQIRRTGFGEKMRAAVSEIWKEKKIQILCIGILSAVVLTVMWRCFGKIPDYVLVGRRTTDYRGEDELVMGPEVTAPDDFYLTFGDVSEGSGVYKFAGNTVKMELYRGMASTVVWGFLDGCIIAFLITGTKRTIARKRRKDEGT